MALWRAFRMVSVALGMVGVLIILSPWMAAFSDGNVGATEALGATKPHWRQDGAAVAYAWSRCGAMHEIATAARPGSIGDPLPDQDGGYACALDRGPTPTTANQLLYACHAPPA